MDLNRVMIIGRLTRDPEVRTTPQGRSVATLGVATNRVWTDQAGAKQERVEYHNCVLWGKLADIAAQYLGKGRRLYVEGRLETRDWTDQSGVKKYRTEIIAESMIMLDGPRGGGAGAAPMSASNTQTDMGGSSASEPPREEEIKVEDIPF